MPRLVPEGRGSGPQLTGLTEEGGFLVDGERIIGGLLLTPEEASAWSVSSMAELSVESLDQALSLDPKPEFLLLGTGKKLTRPSPEFVDALEQRGIGVEVMDSRAASRTWGVLRAEERWVVAALMPLGAS